MNRLVDDLLSLSRVEAEERVRPTAPVDARCAGGRQRCAALMPLAERAGVTLRTEMPQEAVRVIGDADQLRQVLGNLIENAIKYAGRGALVTISLEPPSHSARLRGRRRCG